MKARSLIFWILLGCMMIAILGARLCLPLVQVVTRRHQLPDELSVFPPSLVVFFLSLFSALMLWPTQWRIDFLWFSIFGILFFSTLFFIGVNHIQQPKNRSKKYDLSELGGAFQTLERRSNSPTLLQQVMNNLENQILLTLLNRYQTAWALLWILLFIVFLVPQAMNSDIEMDEANLRYFSYIFKNFFDPLGTDAYTTGLDSRSLALAQITYPLAKTWQSISRLEDVYTAGASFHVIISCLKATVTVILAWLTAWSQDRLTQLTAVSLVLLGIHLATFSATETFLSAAVAIIAMTSMLIGKSLISIHLSVIMSLILGFLAVLFHSIPLGSLAFFFLSVYVILIIQKYELEKKRLNLITILFTLFLMVQSSLLVQLSIKNSNPIAGFTLNGLEHLKRTRPFDWSMMMQLKQQNQSQQSGILRLTARLSTKTASEVLKPLTPKNYTGIAEYCTYPDLGHFSAFTGITSFCRLNPEARNILNNFFEGLQNLSLNNENKTIQEEINRHIKVFKQSKINHIVISEEVIEQYPQINASAVAALLGTKIIELEKYALIKLR